MDAPNARRKIEKFEANMVLSAQTKTLSVKSQILNQQ